MNEIFKRSGIVCAILISAHAKGALGGHDGNGGAGCIATDGSIITFYDCGIYKQPDVDANAPDVPTPLDGVSENPPGLQDLVNFINDFAYLDGDTKNLLLHAVQPSAFRKYFSVVPDALSSQIQNRILYEFRRPTGIDPHSLKLYAVTDGNAKTSYSKAIVTVTYLLPGFSQLQTREERMAALFHETYWVLHPYAAYSKVINAEMIAQALFQNPADAKSQLDFVKMMIEDFGAEHMDYEWVKLLIKNDLGSGALEGFVNKKNQLTNAKFFGTETLDCLSKVPVAEIESSESGTVVESCTLLYIQYVNSLRSRYPKSLFLDLVGRLMIQIKTHYAYDGQYPGPYNPELDNSFWYMFRHLFFDIQGKTYIQSTYKTVQHNCKPFGLGVCDYSRIPGDSLETALFSRELKVYSKEDKKTGIQSYTQLLGLTQQLVSIQLNTDGGTTRPLSLAK